MTNHLKAEIIYYNCATDFEFEFNLNSLCQMRLLSEASDERKTMLTHLSRAVARSRVIFITAPFGDEFIETIAHSIGFKTETIVADEYGISQQTTNKFITSGVPLVTEDGIYAGIILESGPQSLILLPDDRSLRKKIMKYLVNKYILDLCSCESYPVIDTEEVVSETTDVAEDAITDEPTEDTEMATEDAVTTEENISEPIAVQETVTEITADEINDEINEYLDDEPDYFTEAVATTGNNKKGLTILTAILSVILFILVTFIVYSLIIEPVLNGVSILENLKNTFSFLL